MALNNHTLHQGASFLFGNHLLDICLDLVSATTEKG